MLLYVGYKVALGLEELAAYPTLELLQPGKTLRLTGRILLALPVSADISSVVTRLPPRTPGLTVRVDEVHMAPHIHFEGKLLRAKLTRKRFAEGF